MPSDKKINPISFDFELPPLPEIRHLDNADPYETASTKKESGGASEEKHGDFDFSDARKKEVSIKPLSAEDILAARTANQAQRKKTSANGGADKTVSNGTGNSYRESKAKEAEKLADEIFSKKPSRYDDTAVDISKVVVGNMTDRSDAELKNAEGKAIRHPNITDISEDDFPSLDELSSEHSMSRRKVRNDTLTHKELDNSEKKAAAQKMNSEVYHRRQDFDRSRDLNMKNQLISETRMKKSGQGLFVTLFTGVLILCCAALMFFILGKYDVLYIYMTPVEITAALLLLIRSNWAKNASIFLIAVTALVLLIPGLIFMTVGMGPTDADSRFYTPLFVLALALNCISMIILNKNNYVYIYFHTDRDGNEK